MLASLLSRKGPGATYAVISAFILTSIGMALADTSLFRHRAFLAASPFGSKGVRVVPAYHNNSAVSAKLYVFDINGRTGKDRNIWATTAAGLPDRAFVNDNSSVVTLSTSVPSSKGMKGHAVVIYSRRGKVLADYEVSDFLTRREIRAHCHETVSQIEWAVSSRVDFNLNDEQCTITLKWGKKLKFDLRSGTLLRDG